MSAAASTLRTALSMLCSMLASHVQAGRTALRLARLQFLGVWWACTIPTRRGNDFERQSAATTVDRKASAPLSLAAIDAQATFRRSQSWSSGTASMSCLCFSCCPSRDVLLAAAVIGSLTAGMRSGGRPSYPEYYRASPPSGEVDPGVEVAARFGWLDTLLLGSSRL